MPRSAERPTEPGAFRVLPALLHVTERRSATADRSEAREWFEAGRAARNFAFDALRLPPRET
jgi:hypothetical protein